MDAATEALGAVTRDGDRYEVRFVRRFRQPVEKVWAALTVPERIADWLGDAVVDPRPGGAYEITSYRDEEGEGGGWTIRRIEAPRLLEVFWDENETTIFELEPDGAGTRLTVTSQVGPKFVAVMWGWHTFLDALPGAAEGERAVWDEDRRAFRTALKARYRENLDGLQG